MPDNAKNRPDATSLAHDRQAIAATICRDAYGGPLVIRSRGEAYLPRFPREEDEDYKNRLATSVFYDAYGRTVDGLTGMVFRKPPVVGEAVPDEIHDLWENIDLQGTHGDIFAAARHRDGEIDGHFVILVDMQRPDGEVRTLADERSAGLRPYWIGIRKQDVLGFRTARIGGNVVLTHFRYRETATEEDGAYGEREVERIREYNRDGGIVSYRVHELAGEKWVEVEDGVLMVRDGKPMDEIPVAVGYLGEKVGTLESIPPHLSLALENVKHYQLVSDNDNVLHIASVPIPIFIGLDPKGDMGVGPAQGITLPMGADAKMLEPQGVALDAGAKRIEKSEYRMAILGLSMLMSDKRSAETATSKRIDKAESDSALSSHARASQDALEEAVRLTAKWLDIELPEKGEERWVAINTDFDNIPLDAGIVSALANLVAQGDLSQETLWAALQRGEILPPDFDPEVERDRLGAGDLDAIRALIEARRKAEEGGEPEMEEAA